MSDGAWKKIWAAGAGVGAAILAVGYTRPASPSNKEASEVPAPDAVKATETSSSSGGGSKGASPPDGDLPPTLSPTPGGPAHSEAEEDEGSVSRLDPAKLPGAVPTPFLQASLKSTTAPENGHREDDEGSEESGQLSPTLSLSMGSSPDAPPPAPVALAAMPTMLPCEMTETPQMMSPPDPPAVVSGEEEEDASAGGADETRELPSQEDAQPQPEPEMGQEELQPEANQEEPEPEMVQEELQPEEPEPEPEDVLPEPVPHPAHDVEPEVAAVAEVVEEELKSSAVETELRSEVESLKAQLAVERQRAAEVPVWKEKYLKQCQAREVERRQWAGEKEELLRKIHAAEADASKEKEDPPDVNDMAQYMLGLADKLHQKEREVTTLRKVVSELRSTLDITTLGNPKTPPQSPAPGPNRQPSPRPRSPRPGSPRAVSRSPGHVSPMRR